MSMSPLTIVFVTILIIGLSAFFVAVEFALLAAKRHRLEDAALESRRARAALRNASELSLLLAGSQLGITVCTLALGAITKPAVHDWLTPLLASTGLPEITADVIAFILALFIVTFLHLVIGEMAPKSWAISHPETSATLLAIPMRGFLWLTRPLLNGLNSAANAMLLRIGVTPVNAVSAGQDPEALRHLVEHSVNIGALDIVYSTRVATALEMQSTPLRSLVSTRENLAMVPSDARVVDVQTATRLSGHHRILIGDRNHVDGVVHVRDTLTSDGSDGVADLMRPALILEASMSVHEALAMMRRTSSHLAVVLDGGQLLGIVTLNDVIGRLIADAAHAS